MKTEQTIYENELENLTTTKWGSIQNQFKTTETFDSMVQQLKCSQNKQACDICINKNCKESDGFICADRKCKCRSKHRDCQKGGIETIQQCISSKINHHKEINIVLINHIQEAIDNLSKLEEQLTERMKKMEMIQLTVLQEKFYRIVMQDRNLDGSVMNGSQLALLWKISRLSKTQEWDKFNFLKLSTAQFQNIKIRCEKNITATNREIEQLLLTYIKSKSKWEEQFCLYPQHNIEQHNPSTCSFPDKNFSTQSTVFEGKSSRKNQQSPQSKRTKQLTASREKKAQMESRYNKFRINQVEQNDPRKRTLSKGQKIG